MTRRKAKPIVVYKPANFLAVANELGLTIVCYLNQTVDCSDGVRRGVPRDLIGHDGKTLIVYRKADDHYAIDGWAPWHDGMFGGRYDRILQALEWVRIAKGVRAGTIQDFSGRPTVRP